MKLESNSITEADHETYISVINVVSFLDVIRNRSPVVQIDANFDDIQQKLHRVGYRRTIIATLLVVLYRIAGNGIQLQRNTSKQFIREHVTLHWICISGIGQTIIFAQLMAISFSKSVSDVSFRPFSIDSLQ